MELLQLAASTDIVHCPYNVSHSMLRKRLRLHLIKCPNKKKNYAACSFNCEHVMPKHQIEEHENNCPDRVSIDKMVYMDETTRPITIIQNQPTVSSEESWDDTLPSSNVIQSITQKTHCMKPPQGMTRSERKKYRKDLHSVFSNVDISYNQNSNVSERQAISSSNKNTKVQKEKQLFIGKRPNI